MTNFGARVALTNIYKHDRPSAVLTTVFTLNGAGAPILSTVHFYPSTALCLYKNASWNGTQMVYGKGLSLADDVDAHELTHAVTEKSAHLAYYMQSGALNESFSDIFGETVDLTNTGGTDSLTVRRQIEQHRNLVTLVNIATFCHPPPLAKESERSKLRGMYPVEIHYQFDWSVHPS